MIALPSASELFAQGRPRPAAELLAEGAAEAATVHVGANRFLSGEGVGSEAAYKRRVAAGGRIMQHAHIGYREPERTVEAMREVHARVGEAGFVVDRFGITLDWSMGYPERDRAARPRGTGIVLRGADDFARMADAAPAAIHCGDFMLGLPGALENTRAALLAGVTALGNMGQYFTFRLLGWDDDVATTEATVRALGLIAAQGQEVLVHSNLDDGFAAMFLDMCSSIGMVLIEKYIVEDLIGARLAHCYGHHFSDPVSRHAFHRALNLVSDTPGTMIYGNTVSYRSTPAGNYASCASYLLTDILSLRRMPSGHAINPVPVTENSRIPSVDEIVDAQIFAGKLAEHAPGYEPLIDWRASDALAETLVAEGRRFAARILEGLARSGVDTGDAAQMLLALRRLGPRRLEALFGAGEPEERRDARRPVVKASWAAELDESIAHWAARAPAALAAIGPGLTVCVGTTDVHEHGKVLLAGVFEQLGVRCVDAGTAVDPDDLVDIAVAQGARCIALSTYNGVALDYARSLMAELRGRGLAMPVLVGGRLNQVPDGSNTDLPVDVTADLRNLGVIPCVSLDDAWPVLLGASPPPREAEAMATRPAMS